MSNELREGVALRAVTLVPDGDEPSYTWDIQSNCISITVTMQPGQMAMVPWARIFRAGEPDLLYNLAMVESVVLLKQETPNE